jgi:hypothetical protein
MIIPGDHEIIIDCIFLLILNKAMVMETIAFGLSPARRDINSGVPPLKVLMAIFPILPPGQDLHGRR